ncbi:MAG: hypothetical protein IPG61_17570 [bacterium]|nr:hypothetical protein [bacterium]
MAAPANQPGVGPAAQGDGEALRAGPRQLGVAAQATGDEFIQLAHHIVGDRP